MLASFMASMVEFVEALTIVLAVGIVRGRRSALLGTGAALALLVGLVVILGPALARIPLSVVQLAMGTLLLMFGLRWLRKAVLRAAGVLALHDEAKAFAEETEALPRLGTAPGRAVDKVAFAAAFNMVMLEGIEVVFIVIAIGAGGPLLVPASVGALLALVAAFLAIGLALVLVCKRLRRVSPVRAKPTPTRSPSEPGPLAIIAADVWGLFGWLAAGIIASVGFSLSATRRARA